MSEQVIPFRGKSILFVDYAVPQYDSYAGSRTNFMYLELLVQMGFKVIFLPADFKRIEPYSTELNELGIETLDGGKFRKNWESWFKEHGQEIDYVFFNKPEPTNMFLEVVKRMTHAAIIYQCHDLHYLRLRRKAEIEGNEQVMAEARRYELMEDHIFQNCDVILTFSSLEEEIISSKYPHKKVLTVPLYFYATAPDSVSDFSQRQDLIFVGGCAHTPNHDAVTWFCNDILPLVVRKLPNVVINLVGNHPPKDIRALGSKNICIMGGVSDEELNQLYERARLTVIPLRFGAGVKGKMIETFYNGVPFVSTAIGLEGIAGIEAFASAQDDPVSFADEVVALYKDEQRWLKASHAGSTYISDHLTVEKATEKMMDTLRNADIQATRRVELSAAPRSIAFYLPQYHPIKENDEWWGKGFTEWRNVGKAESLFPGHYQPHVPADLGFYDLRLEETRIAQAALARAYGIHGFCFYHYWFNGRRLLERPVEEILSSGKPDFPFCLCWANENWTRRWDGEDQHVLMEMEYSEEDDRAHIRDLFRFFKDERYIKINGKPLFMVYRTENLPDPARTAEVWREEARKEGIGELYLMRVESIGKCDPETIGFDAALEFAPDWWNKGPKIESYPAQGYETPEELEAYNEVYANNYVHSYDTLVETMLAKPVPSYKWMRCVTPSWDNSARRKEGAHIFLDAEPKKYRKWLSKIVAETKQRLSGDEQVVFLNAWNEWAEGNHLEPDLKWGRAYLEATRDALLQEKELTKQVSTEELANSSVQPLLQEDGE